MTNYEKYIKLHSEVMDRLESGEITTEMAKEVNDLAFNKYCIESVEEENELEVFEESARQKYVEQLKARKTKLEEMIKQAPLLKKGQYKKELQDVMDKLHKYGNGAEKGGFNNDDADYYYRDEHNDKVKTVRQGDLDRTGKHNKIDDNAEVGAAHNFKKDLGSKEPTNSKLHDKINQRTQEKDNTNK